MTLPIPKLDDRTFQQIVDEAKKRIPHYTKEWTDHNVSDPGITLVELFAWMTETILYRLNQVPTLHYVTFMEMLGLRLLEPLPAKVPVTFWLSAPQETPVTIPAGTEVATTQTETRASIIFTTDDDLTIGNPALTEVISRIAAGGGKKRYRQHNLRRVTAGFEGADIFTDTPEPDDALYFGFEEPLSDHLLGFEFDFDSAGGAGVDPTLPPYVWEASTGDPDNRWAPCSIDIDQTNALNTPGRIRIHLPHMGRYSVNNETRYWVRLRIIDIDSRAQAQGMRPYRKTPRLKQVTVASWGGTVGATHSQQINREFLGRSDGSPGQRFTLQRTPILKRAPGEQVIVQTEGQPPETWTEVADFADSGSHDKVFTLDSITGELRFGPAVRQPNGDIRLYGAIPPRGANLLFARYRTGGGIEGNVREGVLKQLKTAIPFVARVANRFPARDGLDPETLEAAMVRAPQALRTRDRAVTESDFEFLARQALPARISRVKCLQPRPADAGRVQPGEVYILVIPRIFDPGRYLPREELRLEDDAIARLTTYIDERRLLTTRISVREPAYRWVSVKVLLRAAPGAGQDAVEQEVFHRLYRYLNPLTGGPDGDGWPFGRDLFISDVYQCLQGLTDVQFIRAVELRQAREDGRALGEPVESIDVVAHGAVVSGVHEVQFI